MTGMQLAAIEMATEFVRVSHARWCEDKGNERMGRIYDRAKDELVMTCLRILSPSPATEGAAR